VSGVQESFDHRGGQFRLGLEGELVVEPGGLTAIRIAGPRARDVQLPVHRGVSALPGVDQVDGDLGVLDPSGGAGVLALDADGVRALLHVAGLVDDQHRGPFVEVLDDVVAAGDGAKGHRFYHWAVIDLAEDAPGHRQLLIRRNRSTGELAYYRCHSPQAVPLTTLVKVAGSRWPVEETFQAEKGLAGLDEHQVRRYSSWIRWVTLAILAHAFLTVVRADEHAQHGAPDGLIRLSCNEIQRLFITLAVRPDHTAAHRHVWSRWRRRHQARARACHYRRQAATT